MKALCTILLTMISPVLVAAELVLQVRNAPPTGKLVIQVYDSANAFGDFRDPAREYVIEQVPDGVYRLDDVPSGQVALLTFVDENGNGVLDKNFIGIPREPLGISNDYRPKGPPAFQRAAFMMPGEGEFSVDLELYKVLGERGRIGVGAGVIGQSSPYVGSDETVLQAIPAITYNGERLQWLGPNIQYGIAGSGKLRIAASASYRIGAYEEQDSSNLVGLGDRDNTLLAGLGMRYELPGGINLLARYEHDVLDRIGGGQARIRLSKGFQAGVVRIVPQLALNWLSADLANHDFGVPAAAELPGRPTYEVGDAVSVELGFGSFVELSESWRIVLNLSVEQFGDDVGDSPIVDTDRVIRGFAALTYVF